MMARRGLVGRGIGLAWLALVLAYQACIADDDFDAPSTPFGEPTPTHPPFEDTFRITSLAVGTSSQGVDVDGDGTVDNGMEDTLNAVNEILYNAMTQQLCPEGCSAQQQKVLDAVQGILDQVLSIEGFSQAIQNPIDQATVNYITRFQQQGNWVDVDLEWWTATFTGVSFVLDTALGKQPGKLYEDNHGMFGPGNLTLSFRFVTASGTELVNASLVLQQGFTVVPVYDHLLLVGFYTGGAISVDDLMQLIGAILDTIYALIPDSLEVPLTEEQVLELVEGSVMPYTDVVLEDGSDAFSIGLVGNAESQPVK